MDTLHVTYAVAWSAMACFALKLAMANARLSRRLARLEAQARETPPTTEPLTQAA